MSLKYQQRYTLDTFITNQLDVRRCFAALGLQCEPHSDCCQWQRSVETNHGLRVFSEHFSSSIEDYYRDTNPTLV